MANLTDETEDWPAGVYQLETVDPVVGGTPNPMTGAGMSNIPHLHLAQRTRWLKAAVDAISTALASAIPSTRLISAGGLATGGGSLAADRTITVPKASTAEAIAGTNDDKAVTPLGVARAVTAQAPRWRVTYDVTHTRTTPASIVSAHPGYFGDHPSCGSIIGAGFRRTSSGSGGSYLFEMTLNAAADVTVKQYCAFADDQIYAYLNGTLVFSSAGGTEIGEISWPLVTGDNLLQIVQGDAGGDNQSMSLVGDLLSQSAGLSFVPM